MLVPLAEAGVRPPVGAAADYIPEGMARAAAPELPEMAQHQVMRHYLRYAQDDAGHGPRQRHQRGHLHDEVQPQVHEELMRGHKAADLHPWQDEDTLQGLLEIVYSFGQNLKCDLRHGRLHAAARRRLPRRLHQRRA